MVSGVLYFNVDKVDTTTISQLMTPQHGKPQTLLYQQGETASQLPGHFIYYLPAVTSGKRHNIHTTTIVPCVPPFHSGIPIDQLTWSGSLHHLESK